MPKHYRVSPKFWKGDRRRWDDRKKLLGLYLLTCEHRNLEGYYFLPKGYIQTDLGWPAKVVVNLLAELERDGFVRYDEHAEVVLIVNALAHQAPSTENQIRGAIAALAQVPSSSLWEAFRIACASHAPKLADAMAIASDSGDAPDPNASLACATRTHSSSSSSSSSSIPPLPPRGNRNRDRERYEQDLTAFAAEHFPDVPAGLVNHWASQLRANGHEPTVDLIRLQLEQHNGGVAAA